MSVDGHNGRLEAAPKAVANGADGNSWEEF
jgi:hypothetical protein